MATTSDAFAQALCNAAFRGFIDLDQLYIDCLAKVGAGGGEIAFVLNAGMNGKTAAQQCVRDSAEMLVILDLAFSMTPTTGPQVGVTYADFSGIRA